MAKKPKKKRNPVDPELRIPKAWNIPQPTPGTETYLPEKTQHLQELIIQYVDRCMARPNSKYNVIHDRIETYLNDLLPDYEQALIREHYVSDPQVMLSTMNIVDMSALDFQMQDAMYTFLATNLKKSLNQFEKCFYMALPCYEQGIYQISNSRMFVFQIKELDIAEQSVTIWIQDWLRQSKFWTAGVSGTVQMQLGTPSQALPIQIRLIQDDDYTTYPILYTKVSPQELQWNKNKTEFWERTILQNSIDQLARFTYRQTDPVVELAQMFFSSTTLCNSLMSKHRMTEVIPAPDTSEEPSETIPEESTNRPSKQVSDNELQRRERTIGLLRFISEEPPKRPSKNTIKQYRLASWPSRGHLRHYADGKTVWVKASVHYRKQLVEKGEGIHTVNTVIHLKNNLPIENEIEQST